MGEIYLASDTRLKRDVAIKILPEKWTQNASAVERFMREAQAVSALNHPNILTIYDIGEHNQIKFIATEFVEGQTLRQRMECASLELSEILDIVIQVANALTAAHNAGKRAIKLSPNYPNAHDGYGFYLKAVGRHAEALEKCRQAQRLDPLSPFAHISLGYGYYFARDYDRAIEECSKALELNKYSTFAYRNLGLAYLQLGNIENAINALSKAVTFSSGGPAFESYLGYAYGIAGKRQQALEVLENLLEISKERYVPAYNLAMIYLGLNDLDKTFKWLEKACEERSGFLPFLKVEPMVDNLRADSRFHNLSRQIDLPR